MAQENIQQAPSIVEALASTLLDIEILSADQVEIAFKEHRIQGVSFEECLLNLGFISENALAEAIASTSGHARVNLKQTLFDPSLKELIPRDIAA